MLSKLTRPALLIRAARIGASDYRRAIHLRPLLGGEVPRSGGALIVQLIEMEAAHDHARRSADASYSPLRHVTVLIALMAEARIWHATRDGENDARRAPKAATGQACARPVAMAGIT